MRAATSTAELFPTPDWRRGFPRMRTPGSRLKVRTASGQLIEGTLVSHEPCRAGFLVTIRTDQGDETLVVPTLEVTIPLFDDEVDQPRSA